MNSKKILFLTVLISLCFIGIDAGWSARPGLWETSDIKSWLKGDFKNTGLTSEGHLIQTLTTKETQLPARLAWSSQKLGSRIIVGTSLPSAVYEISQSGDSKKLIQSKDLGFTSSAKFDGAVYLANTPEGNIYRYDSDDTQPQRIASLPDSYVWTMEVDPRDQGIYIGSGPNGNLYHLNKNHELKKIDQVPGNNIMSATIFDGNLFVGDDQGGVFKLKRTQSIASSLGLTEEKTTLHSFYGFSNGEVSALAADDQYLYLGVNHQREASQQQNDNNSMSDLAKQLRQSAMQKRAQQQLGPVKNKSDTVDKPTEMDESNILLQAIRNQAQQQGTHLFSGLSGTIVYRMNPPDQMNIIYNDSEEIVHDLESDGTNLYVATGGNGRLYQVQPDFTRIAFFKSKQELVLDFQLNGSSPGVITTGEGAAAYIPSDESKEATFRSSPFDAHLLARWGNLTTSGQGKVAVRTRTGNTPRPDDHWSDWTEWKSGKRLTFNNNPSRYLQFEIKLLNEESTVNSVQVSYQIPNQRPRIAKLKISPNPIQDVLINKQHGQANKKNRGNSSNGKPSANSAFSLDPRMTSKRQIQWKVIDPDGDPTLSQIFYKPLDGEKWISFTKGKYTPEEKFTLDTRNLADGRYRIKVTATDKPFNDPSKSFEASKTSSPILIDNASPSISNITVKEQKISFTATDSISRILLSQYRINGDNWQSLLPEDEIFDAPKEKFQFQLDEKLQSGDLLELRVLDEGGNTVHRKHTVK